VIHPGPLEIVLPRGTGNPEKTLLSSVPAAAGGPSGAPRPVMSGPAGHLNLLGGFFCCPLVSFLVREGMRGREKVNRLPAAFYALPSAASLFANG